MEEVKERETRRLAPLMGYPAYRLAVGDECVCKVPGGLKKGLVVYIHPEGRFVVAEFEGEKGIFGGTSRRYRETLWPEKCQRYTRKGAEILKNGGKTR